MTKIEKFTHNGRDFEIRAAALDQGIEAQSFYKGKRIARYTATYETAADNGRRPKRRREPSENHPCLAIFLGPTAEVGLVFRKKTSSSCVANR